MVALSKVNTQRGYSPENDFVFDSSLFFATPLKLSRSTTGATGKGGCRYFPWQRLHALGMRELSDQFAYGCGQSSIQCIRRG